MNDVNQLDEIENKKIAEKRRKRTEKVMFSIGITSIVFIVASYAWFIGTTQVAVEPFEIGVKSSEGLTISLDGKVFNNIITVNKEAVTTGLTTAYPTHTNHWVGDEGLEPVSTVGKFNENASALDIFSKTSITSLNGGYKLRTDLIGNVVSTPASSSGGSPTYTISEKDGYVAFDIFIKNQSGSTYNKPYNQDDDEGIYLIKESQVILTSTGTDAQGQPLTGGDGIENSIRVAFMQVGRVNSKVTGNEAQEISCVDSDTNTSLCNMGTSKIAGGLDGQGITWNIWEPNDLAHNEDSVQHFAKICKKRTAATTYEGACDELKDNTYFSTYAANDNINSEDDVNIYDGLNGYESISEKLTKFTYFTDTKKDVTGSAREEIFYLAPNSITKIRVYVYLEGQDVDNYDLGIIGKKISITFGFTKDKFDTMDDVIESSSASSSSGEEEPSGGSSSVEDQGGSSAPSGEEPSGDSSSSGE